MGVTAMETVTVVLLITALSIANAQEYYRHREGEQASPHYHEFDYRRFGGYPVHIGNGQFRFLGDSSHHETHTSLEGSLEHLTAAQDNSNLNYYPQKSSTRKGNTDYRQHTVSKPSDVVPPKGLPYTKVILSPGDRTRFPKQGDTVEVWYTGRLTNGEIFDSNLPDGTKGAETESKPLTFPVGTGLVIRGWEESLLTMSVGEKARVTIQPEWAYGEKGAGGGKIPPNAVLIFEMQLAAIH